MKIAIILFILIFPASVFSAPPPTRISKTFSNGTGNTAAGNPFAADTVARDTGWIARVRRTGVNVIRHGQSQRAELATRVWTPAEVIAKERERGARTIAAADGAGYSLALRVNLLRWATLTPDIGVEWRVNRRWGATLRGTWTSWSWQHGDRRYVTWQICPAVRYYTGKDYRLHVGAEFLAGEFNHKLSTTGKQGNYLGGGLSGGYRLPLNHSFALDFSAGISYTRVKYDKYHLVDNTRVKHGSVNKGRWGVTNFEISLEFRI